MATFLKKGNKGGGICGSFVIKLPGLFAGGCKKLLPVFFLLILSTIGFGQTKDYFGNHVFQTNSTFITRGTASVSNSLSVVENSTTSNSLNVSSRLHSGIIKVRDLSNLNGWNWGFNSSTNFIWESVTGGVTRVFFAYDTSGNLGIATNQNLAAFPGITDDEAIREARRGEYPPKGDQLDNITKCLKYLAAHGVDIGPDGTAQVSACDAVKTKYPKS